MNIAACLGARVKKKHVVTDGPLCERHAPRTSLDIVLDEVCVAILRKWLQRIPEDSPRHEDMVAFVTAHVGSGLSTLLRLLIEELGFEPIWIHTGTKQVNVVLHDAGSSPIAANGRRKLIVMDEFDSMTTDKRTMSAVIEYVKSSGKTKMVCAGHPSRSIKASEFAIKWTRIEFPKVSSRKLEAVLRNARIPNATPDAIQRAASNAKGDVRSAFNALDFSPSGGVESDVKDSFVEGLDGVDVALSLGPLSVRDSIKMTDASVVSMGIFENYTMCLGDPDLGIAADVTNACSHADVINDIMYETQNWDLSEIHGVFSIASPAYDLRRRTNTKTIRAEKFGTVWSRLYNAKAKAKNVAMINMKRQERGLPCMNVTDLAYHRHMIETTLQNGSDDDIRRVCGCLDERHVLALMRLGNTSYKHARIKKLLGGN